MKAKFKDATPGAGGKGGSKDLQGSGGYHPHTLPLRANHLMIDLAVNVSTKARQLQLM